MESGMHDISISKKNKGLYIDQKEGINIASFHHSKMVISEARTRYIL